MSMARAETSMIDRPVGDTGGIVMRTMRIIGGESDIGRQDTADRSMCEFMTTYDLAALAALTNLICIC